MKVSSYSKIYYGWIIVLACFIVTFAGLGVINSMSGVLLKPICDSLGFTRAQFTLHRTIMVLIGAASLPVYGKIYSRKGTKCTLLVCSVMLSIITFSYSFATKIWHFHLIAILNGFFVSGPSFMTASFLINNWFVEKRGFATGIAFAGAGIGSAIFIPIVGWMASVMDWQLIYRFIGVIVFVLLVPSVILLIKNHPQDMGLKPYSGDRNPVTSTKVSKPKYDLTIDIAVKMPLFWMLILAFFLLSIMAGGPNINCVPYLTDIGYAASFASLVMATLMLTHMLGNILIGRFFDRYGILVGSIFLGLCCVVFPIFAVHADNPLFVWLYVLFYGPASSGFAVPLSVFVLTYFGNKDFAVIFSVITMATQVGTALSGPLMGVFYDMLGSYTGGWIMLSIFGGIIVLCLTGAYLAAKVGADSNKEKE